MVGGQRRKDRQRVAHAAKQHGTRTTKESGGGTIKGHIPDGQVRRWCGRSAKLEVRRGYYYFVEDKIKVPEEAKFCPDRGKRIIAKRL